MLKDIDLEEAGSKMTSHHVTAAEDIFAERESKHLSWSSVNMVLVRKIP